MKYIKLHKTRHVFVQLECESLFFSLLPPSFPLLSAFSQNTFFFARIVCQDRIHGSRGRPKKKKERKRKERRESTGEGESY